MSKQKSSSKLVALVFEPQEQTQLLSGMYGGSYEFNQADPEQARAVLKAIEEKAKEAKVKLEDAVIVYKDHEGKVQIEQTKDITSGRGARWGSFWGLLVGLLLGGPIVGLLGGLGLGAIYGKMTDHGIDDKFIKSVGGALERNASAIMLLVPEDIYDPAMAYLRSFDTEIVEADLKEEAEEAVLEAAEKDEVAQAVKSEYGKE